MKDPRTIITPYAFEVDKKLLGRPLASPSRRLFALLTDLLLAGITSLMGAYVLAIIATIAFFRTATRRVSTSLSGKLFKYGLSTAASVLVFMVTASISDFTFQDTDQTIQEAALSGEATKRATKIAEEESRRALLMAEKGDQISPEEWEQFGEEVRQRVTADSSLSRWVRNDSSHQPATITDEDIRQVKAFLAARANGNEATMDSLIPLIGSTFAAPELDRLDEELDRLDDDYDDLEDDYDDLKEAYEELSFYQLFKLISHETGIALGWIGIYFILSLAWLDGQTPGKRLFKIRVIRLNNKPLSLWYSFERFGGYAAGLATGLLGFVQIYWDANRQGIHDKIAGTVVVDLHEEKELAAKKIAFEHEIDA